MLRRNLTKKLKEIDEKPPISINLWRAIVLGGTILASMMAPMTAHADEIRFGIAEHDSRFFDNGKEQSAALFGEYVFESPKALHWARSPKPYIGGALNLQGETSFAGAGLLWRTGLSRRVYGEVAFGGSVHNGHKRVPNPSLETDPDVIAELVHRKETEIEFGSKVLFRIALTVGYEINDDWALELVHEHYSHGHILGGPENEGSSELGVRVSKRF